jgi:hypothetical protein
MQHPGLTDQTQNPPSTQAPKRKQVKNACSKFLYTHAHEQKKEEVLFNLFIFIFNSIKKIANCQKACKKCDDARPCPRCIKYGIADTCVNSVRKERKKGIKRGPYKRRQKSGKNDIKKKKIFFFILFANYACKIHSFWGKKKLYFYLYKKNIFRK